MENNEKELHPLLRRAMLFLEDGDWGSADDYCERYLDMEPEGAYAYVIKLMARVKVDREEDLANVTRSYRGWNSYENACRFADQALRERLEGYLEAVEENLRQQELQRIKEEEERIEREQEQLRLAIEAQNEEIYNKGLIYQKSTHIDDLTVAVRLFNKIPDYKDSRERIDACKEKMAEAQAIINQKRQENLKKEHKRKRTRTIVILIVVFSILSVIVAGAIITISGVNIANSVKAKAVEKELVGMTFYGHTFDSETNDKGGAIVTLSMITECDVYYNFVDENTVHIETDGRYDKEPFVMQNGERQWDEVFSYSQDERWGNVQVSFFGEVTVIIDGERCPVEVDINNIPLSIEIDGDEYSAY